MYYRLLKTYIAPLHLSCVGVMTTTKRENPIMPIVGMVSGSIIASSSSKTEDMKKIAQAVESGVYQWLSTPTVKVEGVAQGTAGVGALGGSVIVSPNAGLMESAFKSNGVVGKYAPMIWTPIMVGISKPYMFVGKSSVVGVGSYTGGFVGEPNLLMGKLMSSFTSFGIIGSKKVKICRALSQGIYQHFLQGQVFGAVVGPPSPSATAGQATGKFI